MLKDYTLEVPKGPHALATQQINELELRWLEQCGARFGLPPEYGGGFCLRTQSPRSQINVQVIAVAFHCAASEPQHPSRLRLIASLKGEVLGGIWVIERLRVEIPPTRRQDESGRPCATGQRSRLFRTDPSAPRSAVGPSASERN